MALLIQGIAVANTTYTFGSTNNVTLGSESSSAWTEVGSTSVDCVVGLASISACGLSLSIPGNAASLPSGTSNYLAANGTSGNPVWTNITGLSQNTSYTVSFSDASSNGNGQWLAYILPGGSTGAASPSSANLAHTSATTANWQADSFTFATGSGQTNAILEFVASGSSLADLAAVSVGDTFQLIGGNQSVPEPDTATLTMLGAGLVFIGSKLRRRPHAKQ